MWALVFNGPGQRSWEQRPKPRVQAPTDAVVKITKTTICGTDLHILKGDVPAVQKGRILGHEGVGVIDSVGEAVGKFKKGDRVLISCITSDGRCGYCRRAMYSHCEGGGWVLGHLIDGTQAEYVRIPFADTSLYAIPKGADEEALVMLSDILPTGYECGVLNGEIQPGDSVAIVGAGPIGLATLLTAQFFSPSELIVVDLDDHRLEVAAKFGATQRINSGKEDAVAKILALTGNRGVDVAIEAVGVPQTFDLCQRMISPGGRIANIGVHGKSVELRLQDLWIKNITLRTRLVDTESTPLLLKTVTAGKVKPGMLISHRFKMNEMMKAYDTFGNAQKEQAMKVIISAD
ncbi:MAG: zinc-dependent alcohol dehydrogenase family protein [Oligoflexia bacterium]|nr:zinc-dependent alcohol dehydrogenase family protein [Oligoflexia bacterium]